MIGSDVDRVHVHSDENWETHFIPWLEEKESAGIGRRDGVFVATFDISIRTVRPQTEKRFLELCINKKNLNSVSQLTCSSCNKDARLFTISSDPVGERMFNRFKENACQLQLYSDDTCCSKILKQGGDLEMLLRHFDSDVLNAGNRNTRSSASSHVIMQETAQKIRLLHSKFSQDTSSFPWERRLKTPPDACPEAECDVIQSYSTGEDDGKDEGEDNTGLILYGYGTEVPDSDIRVTANLSLGRIFNILWLLPYHYPGIQTPYTYYGWTHSMFSIHVEDALTWSVNYMFMGGMKIWVVVPPHASALLEYHLQRGSPISDSKCRNILGHKTVMPTVGWLRDHAIPFKIVVQRPGDLIVLLPGAAHFGFSTGPNICQAVNLGTVSWIPSGLNAKKCNCFPNQVHLDVAPLVAAFRPDLLQSLLKNKVIVTPQTMTGMELLVKDIHKYGINTALPPISTQEDERSLDEGTSMFNCPVSECGLTFGNSSHDLIKRAMVKHVKSSHRPIILSDNLLFKISRLFPSKRKTAL